MQVHAAGAWRLPSQESSKTLGCLAGATSGADPNGDNSTADESPHPGPSPKFAIVLLQVFIKNLFPNAPKFIKA